MYLHQSDVGMTSQVMKQASDGVELQDWTNYPTLSGSHGGVGSLEGGACQDHLGAMEELLTNKIIRPGPL
jgi:hypothetical protein